MNVVNMPSKSFNTKIGVSLLWTAFPGFKLLISFRRSHSEVFGKKGVLKNFTIFTGKQLCHLCHLSLWPVTLLTKRLWHRWFPVNFVKFPRTPFFIEHLWWPFVTSFVITSFVTGLKKLIIWIPIVFNCNYTAMIFKVFNCMFHNFWNVFVLR